MEQKVIELATKSYCEMSSVTPFSYFRITLDLKSSAMAMVDNINTRNVFEFKESSLNVVLRRNVKPAKKRLGMV